jgi:response regulator RpfG family c-di-GMP phosphodiesterase
MNLALQSFSSQINITQKYSDMKDNLVVMLIDDSPSEHRLFREVLNTINPSIRLISMMNGKKAVSYFSHPSMLPDYVFLDMEMPEL